MSDEIRSVRSRKKDKVEKEALPPVPVYDRATLRGLKTAYTDPPANLINCEHLKVPSSDSPTSADAGFLSRDVMMKNLLVVGENAWTIKKPATEDEEYEKQFRGMLNKLAPQKFDDVIKSFDLSRVCSTPSKMGIAVKLVFEKALQEPSYSQLYVSVCKNILELPASVQPVELGAEFRKQIISFAQTEFETTMNNIAASASGEGQNDMKKRQKTNTKFIAEMFLASALTIRVIRTVVNKLLNDESYNGHPSELCMEMLVMLLTIAGSKIDEVDHDFINKTMTDIQEMIDDEVFPPRVTFLLMGIVETRANGWVPRVSKAGEQNVVVKSSTPVAEQPARKPAWGSSSDLPRVMSESKIGSGAIPSVPKGATTPLRSNAPGTPLSQGSKKPASPATSKGLSASRSQPTLDTPPSNTAGPVPVLRKKLASGPAVFLQGDAKQEALRLNPSEITPDNIRASLLTALNELCLLGKKEEAITTFMKDPGWDPLDVIEAFAVALSYAIKEDKFSDCPKYLERWQNSLQGVVESFSGKAQVLHRLVGHYLTTHISEDEDDDDQSSMVNHCSDLWAALLNGLDKDKSVDVAKVLDGIYGFLQVAGCPGILIDAVGDRAVKSLASKTEGVTAWFREKVGQGSTTVERMKPYFKINF